MIIRKVKYRVWPRINTVHGSYPKHAGGYAATRLTQVFEIQRKRWWGWQHVETWASEELAIGRVLQLTGPDRPSALSARLLARIQSINKDLYRLIAQLSGGNLRK